MLRTLALVAWTVIVVLSTAQRSSAQVVDLTIFGGLAFPTYDERLTLGPSSPSLPGVEVSVAGSPVLRADGGGVFGASLAFELGIVGIEGRLDVTQVGLEFSGARYDLRGTDPPFQGLSASLIAEAGRFDADRIPLLSLNARLRTPGPVSLVVSGGVSYLPDIRVTGAVPLTVQAPGLPLPAVDAGLALRATPGQTGHRFGVNGGAGVRVGGRIGLSAEARAFYFREFALRFGSTTGPQILDELLEGVSPVRFTPIFVNAQVGLSFRF